MKGNSKYKIALEGGKIFDRYWDRLYRNQWCGTLRSYAAAYPL